MNFPLFIAKRLYRDQGDKRKVSRPAIHIATAGVAIGLAIMIMSVCVVLGFKHTIRDKVIGFGSHIQVADFMTLQQQNQYPVVMNDSMVKVLQKIPGVKHVQRFAMKEGILKTDNDFLGVVLKGVGPDFDSTFIHQNMVEGSIPKFDDKASHNQILISKLMADKLKLKNGERIFAYFIDNQGVRMRRFTIAGIYETNLKKYDELMVYTDLYTAVKLNGWEDDQASGAELTVKDFDKLNETEDYVINKVNRTVDHYGERHHQGTESEHLPMAQPDGPECMDYPGTDAHRGRRNDDQRIAHHHPGAHFNDWSDESPGCPQQDHPPHLPLVCRIHHRQGNVTGQCHRTGTSCPAAFHGNSKARCPDLLRKYGTGGVQLALYRGT